MLLQVCYNYLLKGKYRNYHNLNIVCQYTSFKEQVFVLSKFRVTNRVENYYENKTQPRSYLEAGVLLY